MDKHSSSTATWPNVSNSQSNWQGYRGCELQVFSGPDYPVGLLRCEGELLAYCEAISIDATQQHLEKIADEHLRKMTQRSLDSFTADQIFYAMEKALKNGEAASRRLFKAHAAEEYNALPLVRARQLTGLKAYADVLMLYARLGRALFDILHSRPAEPSDGREPYLACVLCATREAPNEPVLCLQPEVYCALRTLHNLSIRPTTDNGHRATQDLSRSQKHAPLW